ncbi:MAG: response regulator transcription factor [Hyphomicrobiales bacterium]|nr:response regulator transcription factor [Hyphomicrobiales bacterium]
MSRSPISIILVGSRFLIREGIARILIPENFRILASVPKICELALSSVSQFQPLLLMIDGSDDMAAALEQVTCFKTNYPKGRVAVMNDRSQPNHMISALRAGANAYLVNIENCDSFIKSLEVVMLGETLLWSGYLPNLLEHSPGENPDDGVANVKALAAPQINGTPRLSERQQCILRCLAEGATNRVIANKIDMEEATVKVHVRTVLQKIRARNRTQAAVWALNNGLSPKTLSHALDSNGRAQN